MTPEEMRTLFEYDAWANARTLNACAALTQEQFTRSIVSSFSSVRDTLVHIVGSERSWLRCWKEPSPQLYLHRRCVDAARCPIQSKCVS